MKKFVLLWKRFYKGPTDSTDFIKAVVVDDSGDVYVTGQSMGTDTSYDYATIKYDNKGNELWVVRYICMRPILSLSILLIASLLRAQGWQYTDSLNTARSRYAAVSVAPSGEILVTGGYNSSTQSSIASCEIYDPVAEEWHYIDSLNTARRLHTATLLQDGRILVVGGFLGGTNYLSSCELYDPRTGEWSFTDSLPVNLFGHTATLLPSGKVLVAGGFSSQNGFETSSFIYDPNTETWSFAGHMNRARMLHEAVLLPSGKVLVISGCIWSPAGPTCELYDPETGNWEFTGSLADKRESFTATLLMDGRVLVAGGLGNEEERLRRCELYDPSTGSWTLTDSMEVPRFTHSAVLLPSGKVLVSGGLSWGGTTNTCEIYDPIAESWSLTDPLNKERSFHESFFIPSNNKVIVIGGDVTSSCVTSSCEINSELVIIQDFSKTSASSHPVELWVNPNPFRDRVNIRWGIDKRRGSEEIALRIYDVTGCLVKDFNLRSALLSPSSTVSWDGTDDLGNKIPGGVYFLRLEAGDYQATKKLLLVR